MACWDTRQLQIWAPLTPFDFLPNLKYKNSDYDSHNIYDMQLVEYEMKLIDCSAIHNHRSHTTSLARSYVSVWCFLLLL